MTTDQPTTAQCGPACAEQHTYHGTCALLCAEIHGSVASPAWSVACPACEAPADRPCRRRDGSVATVECRKRWDAWERATDAQQQLAGGHRKEFASILGASGVLDWADLLHAARRAASARRRAEQRAAFAESASRRDARRAQETEAACDSFRIAAEDQTLRADRAEAALARVRAERDRLALAAHTVLDICGDQGSDIQDVLRPALDGDQPAETEPVPEDSCSGCLHHTTWHRNGDTRPCFASGCGCVAYSDVAERDRPAETDDGCVHLRDGGCCSGPGVCAHACGEPEAQPEPPAEPERDADAEIRGVQAWMALDLHMALGRDTDHSADCEHQGHESWADWWADLCAEVRRGHRPAAVVREQPAEAQRECSGRDSGHCFNHGPVPDTCCGCGAEPPAPTAEPEELRIPEAAARVVYAALGRMLGESQ